MARERENLVIFILKNQSSNQGVPLFLLYPVGYSDISPTRSQCLFYLVLNYADALFQPAPFVVLLLSVETKWRSNSYTSKRL